MNNSQGAIEAKYLDQIRRNRELNVRLESERSKVSKLTQRVIALEKEKLQMEEQGVVVPPPGSMLPSQRQNAAKAAKAASILGTETAGSTAGDSQSELEDLRDKVDKLGKSLASVRKQLDDSKRDLTKCRRALQLEIGDESAVERALEAAEPTSPATGTPTTATATAGGAGGWRGRAQQISILRGRVKDLERQLLLQTQQLGGGEVLDTESALDGDGTKSIAAVTTLTMRTAAGGQSVTTARDFDDVNRSLVEQRQKLRKLESKELQMQIDAKQEETDRERTRAESLQARLFILERDNQHLRSCIQCVVEKTENDDKLIAAYKQELEEKRQEVRRAMTAGMATRPNELHHLLGSGRSNHINNATTSDNAEIENARLRETVSELRRQLHASTSVAAPISNQAWKEIDKAISESAALTLVEDQRQALMAFEKELEKRDQWTTSQLSALTVQGIDTLLQEENTSLKVRIRTLSSMMEKEIALHAALAAAHSSANKPASAAGSVASATGTPSAVGPVAGRRASRKGADEGGSGDGASSSEALAKQQQYDELKRAYNAQASRLSQLESRLSQQQK